MGKQMSKQWLTINEAAELFKKSSATIRRLVKNAPEIAVKREQLRGRGGEKILLSKDFLSNCFEATSQTGMMDTGTIESGAGDVLGFLFQQIEQKDRQIEALQKQVETNSEREREMIMLNAALQTKLLNSKNEVTPIKQSAGGSMEMVFVSVSISLIIGLALYLIFSK